MRKLFPAALFATLFHFGCSNGGQPTTPQTETVADKAKGAVLFNTCVACHGDKAQGNLQQGAPAIAGQESWYLEAQLRSFRAGHRGFAEGDVPGKAMAAISKTLASESDLADVAAYIADLPPALTETTVVGDTNKGRDYYNMICGACHSNGAVGNASLHSPRLVGLNDWYLLRELEHFRSGMRGTHADDTYGAQMRTMAVSIPDEQTVKDLVAYIHSLQKAE